MSKVHQRGPIAPRMNITPLIDVVFLLIVFFMLVNNLVARHAVEMMVPDLTEPRTRELEQEGRLVISVVPQAYDRRMRETEPLAAEGVPLEVLVGASQRVAHDDTAGIRSAVERAAAERADLEVIVRADAALHYEHVQVVLEAVRDAGVREVNVVAHLPDAREIE